MLDILVVIFACLMLYRIDYNKGAYYADYMTVQNVKPVKGIFAVVVIFHHLAQQTKGGLLFHHFSDVGFLAVSFFFFFSGYGVWKRYCKDETYRSIFLYKRVLTVLIPYLLFVMLYWGLSAVEKPVYTVSQVIKSFASQWLVVPHGWFVHVLLLFYVFFFIFIVVWKKNYVGIVISFVGVCVIWSKCCRYLGYGFCWYNTCLVLVSGICWSLVEDKIREYIQKYYLYWLYGSVLLFVCGFRYIESEESYMQLGLHWIVSCLFVLILVMVLMKVRIRNKILVILGENSYELYLIHMFFMKLYRGKNIYIHSEFLWGVLVLVSSVICAIPLHRILMKTMKCMRIR